MRSEEIEKLEGKQNDCYAECLYWEAKIKKIKDKIRVIKGSNKVNRDYDINCGYTLDLIDKICEEKELLE